MSTAIASAPEVVTGRLRMLGDRILIRPLEWSGEQVHGNGTSLIVLRDGRAVRGEAVAVGPGRFPFVRKGKTRDNKHQRVSESKHFLPTVVQQGDIIEFGCLKAFDGQSYQFPEVIYNGVRHLIITERDVTGVWVRSDRRVVAEARHLESAAQ